MPRGPDQAKAKQQGNAYFTTAYPQLSYIKSAKRVWRVKKLILKVADFEHR